MIAEVVCEMIAAVCEQRELAIDMQMAAVCPPSVHRDIMIQ